MNSHRPVVYDRDCILNVCFACPIDYYLSFRKIRRKGIQLYSSMFTYNIEFN